MNIYKKLLLTADGYYRTTVTHSQKGYKVTYDGCVKASSKHFKLEDQAWSDLIASVLNEAQKNILAIKHAVMTDPYYKNYPDAIKTCEKDIKKYENFINYIKVSICT